MEFDALFVGLAPAGGADGDPDGLADAEILQVMENSPSPERMKKMREIILLMRKRKAGV
jgi:hypothetical protein